MHNNKFTSILLPLAALAMTVAPSVEAAADKPNIVVMLVDNLGYGDIGAYGGGALRGAPTPQIDQLAAEGMKLTNFNVEPECTPTRSALLTGRMPIRSGLAGQVGGIGDRGGLSPWEVTLPELLKQAGYQTAMYGKWHLGEQPGRQPNDQGFDEWWGFLKSSNDTVNELQAGWSADIAPPQRLWEGKAGEASKEVGVYDLKMRPLMDATITQKSVAYIDEHAKDSQPFFLYVPFSLPHGPAMPNSEFNKQGKTNYQNVLSEIDANTGEILAALKRNGIEGETLVVWASDNGPETFAGPGMTYGGHSDSGPFRGEFPSAWEGAIRTPGIIRWPGHVPSGKSSNETVSVLDFYSTLAQIAGVADKIPQDRAIDSQDQSALFLGQQDKSARDSVMFFYDNELMAVKWRNIKVHMVLRAPLDAGPLRSAGQGVLTGQRITLNYPLVFDIENDPKELWNINAANEWVSRPLSRILGGYGQSLQKFPNLQPGQLAPAKAQ